ncbi:MAG: hypothetical protein ACQETH_02985 [Candidatus Rifleibacteriota bacterium]
MTNFTLKKKTSGTIYYLIIALLLTLSVSVTAMILNQLHRASMVKTSIMLKADYEMESAIVMQLQKLKQSSKIADNKIIVNKVLSPGFTLKLEGNSLKPEIWGFEIEVEGPGFIRKMKAKASINNPDQIIYLKNS